MKRGLCFLVCLLMLVSLLVIPVSASQTTEMANNVVNTRQGVVRFYTMNSKTGDAYVGSGFAIGESGKATDIFATNFHVIEGCDIWYILLDNDWKASVPEYGGKADNVHAVRCEIVYENGEVPDFAIMRTQRVITERSCIPLMPSHLAYPGDTVFALGYPAVADRITDGTLADIDAMTVTRGTLSRFITNEGRGGVRTIQTDASINGGNSGGPLVTEEGYVIGLNTWSVNDTDGNMNLALEIDYVIEKLDELISSGKLTGFSYTLITERPSGEPEGNQPGEKPGGTQPSGDTQQTADPLIIGLIALCVAMAGISLYLVLKLKKRIEHTRAMRAASMAVVKSSAPVQADSPAPRADGSTPKTEPRQAGGVILCGVSGQFAGKKIAVQKELRLGRNPGSDIRFDQATPGVSGNHCVISPDNDGVFLTDVGSSNGTYLHNGSRLNVNQKYTLKSGDMFYAGSKQQCFRVEIAGEAPKTMAAATSAKLQLVCLEGPLAGRSFPVDKDLHLGRNPENDIIFPSGTPGVSGKHCRVSPRENGIALMDLGSSVGTFSAGGTKLAPNQKYLIRKGENFYLGSKQNVFRVE